VQVVKSGGKRGLFGASKKEKAAAKFEPGATLCYYGTLGGGFGTPRQTFGVALGQFNVPAWMGLRPSGDLIVSSTFANEMQVLSPRGSPVRLLTHDVDGDALINPQGIVVDPIDETMYTCCNNRVHQFKWRPDHGGYVAERATPKPAPRNVTPATPEPPPEGIVFNSEARAASGAGRAILSKPLGLAMRDGVLFVASSGNNLIVVLDAATLRLLFTFGSDQLVTPSACDVYQPDASKGADANARRPLLYVTDRGNDRLSVFTLDGAYVHSIGKRGRAPGCFIEPLGLCVRDQRVFVCEGIGARLQVLSPSGSPLLCLTSPTGGRLVGVSWHETRLYVSEIDAHRLHVFKIIE